MPPRIDHPHVAIEGSGGPAGHLYGHPHSADRSGLTYQCGAMFPATRERCAAIHTVKWAEIDALNKPRLEGDDPNEMIHLPPCPACGGITMFGVNDVEYGSDLPEHHTMKILREHIATRPAFKNLRCWSASMTDGKHQGFDFSHLPEHERPAHHRPVDLATELARPVGPASIL